MYGCQAFILSVRLTNILPPFCQVHDTLSRNRFVSQGIFYFPLENQRDVIDLCKRVPEKKILQKKSGK